MTKFSSAVVGGLSQIQLELCELLQRRSTLVGDAQACATIARHVTGNPRLSPAEQLEIYRKQYWLRHTSALVEDFIGLSGVLGQSSWERLVEGYLEAHPPTGFSLRDLGARLPEHVARQEWLHPHRLCADMARLEWAMIECFDAPDAPLLDPVSLANLKPEAWLTARFLLSPALRLLRLSYPVADLRKALKQGQAVGEPVLLPPAAPQYLVVFRQNRELKQLAIPRAALSLLEHFGAGAELIAGVEASVANGEISQDDIDQHLIGWFREWAQRGWISSVITA